MEAIQRAGLALFDGQGRRISWRRLLVWVAACAFLYFDLIDSMEWLTVSAVYIGGDSAEAIARRWGVKHDDRAS